MSDPNSKTDEALGRMFNALATAYDYKQAGEDVSVYFNGTGTRWIKELSNPEHPINGLFQQVSDTVAGISCGCADFFGASDATKSSNFIQLNDNNVPGTSGLLSMRKLHADGYNVLTF